MLVYFTSAIVFLGRALVCLGRALVCLGRALGCFGHALLCFGRALVRLAVRWSVWLCAAPLFLQATVLLFTYGHIPSYTIIHPSSSLICPSETKGR